MTRHIRYVGENHFPPFESEDKPCGWYLDGNRTRYGPLPERVRFVKPENTHAPELPRVAHDYDAKPPCAEPYDPAAKWRA